YFDSVHLIADEQKLSALRVELLDLLPSDSARLRDWLRDNRVVFPGCEGEVAAQMMRLAKQALNGSSTDMSELRPVVVSNAGSKPAASKPRKRPLDLLAASGGVPEPQHQRQRHEQVDETAPLQLALF